MQQRPPSFAEVFALVWKVVFAVLLVPAVIALAYVALRVIPAALVVTVLAVVLLAGWVMISLKLRR